MIQRMRFACLITKATDTHLILIAFPRQLWLRERASNLRYTYIACHVCFIDSFKDTFKDSFKDTFKDTVKDTFKLLGYLMFSFPKQPDRV
jgi:hypothetical protein